MSISKGTGVSQVRAPNLSVGGRLLGDSWAILGRLESGLDHLERALGTAWGVRLRLGISKQVFYIFDYGRHPMEDDGVTCVTSS